MTCRIRLHSIVAIFLTAITVSADAQKVYVHHFDTFRTFKTDVYYEKIRVIDNRPDKSNIGYLRKETSMSGKKVDLVTDTEDLEGDLQKYVAHLTKGKSKTDKELLLVVYGFMAEDQPNANEMASFHIRMDGFFGDGNTYHYIGTVDSLHEEVSGNASRIIRPLISEKLFHVLTKFVSTEPEKINTTNYTLAEAKNRAAKYKESKPVYSEAHKEGIYLSYKQFLGNEPEPGEIIAETYTLPDGVSESHLYIRKDNGRKGEVIDPKKVFAAYCKETWYLSTHGAFNKMQYENNEFYGYIRMKGVYNNTASMMVLFGVAGGLFMSEAMTGKTWGTYKARLDAEQGKLIPVKRVR